MKHILSKIGYNTISKITAGNDFAFAMWLINKSMPHLNCDFSKETVITIKDSDICDDCYASFKEQSLNIYAKCFKFINCKFGSKTLHFNKNVKSILFDGCDISLFPHFIFCSDLKVVTFKNMIIKNFIFMSDLKWDKENNTFDIVFENCTFDIVFENCTSNKEYKWSQKSRVRVINCTNI